MRYALWMKCLAVTLGAIFSVACLADATRAAGKDIHIVFIPKSGDQYFWTFMRAGVDRAVAEAGNVALTWRGPAYNDQIDAQIKILQLYTHPTVDAIVLVPAHRTRLMEPVRRARALGIKVIVLDSPLDGSDHVNFIGTDNYAAGMLAAERLSSLLNAMGEVLLLRTVAGSGSTDLRANGFKDYVKKHAPMIRIVVDEYGGGSRGQVFHAAAELLARHPHVDGIFAVNESATDGMLRALRQAGLAGKKKFVGVDSTSFLLTGLERKEIDGLIVQDPRRMGYVGLEAALGALKSAPIAHRSVFIDAVMVTLENYRKPEIRALLVP